MKRLSLATAALLLAACSGGEPSNEDIKAALEKETTKVNDQVKAMAADNPQAAAMLGNTTLMKVEKVEKAGCKKDGTAYLCDVSMALTMPMIGTQTQTVPLRLVKTDSGWTVAGGM